MLLRRRSDEADGESKMMGSGRREGFPEARRAGVGAARGAEGAGALERRRKSSVYLRMWEKSCRMRWLVSLCVFWYM